MITSAELHRLARKEGLRFDQAEKDYVIFWVLSGLAHSGAEEHGWVFKGGTCLRHCYYKGYRLGPMLKDVPDFDPLWKEWVRIFHELVEETQ